MSKQIYGFDRFSARNIESMFDLKCSKTALLNYEGRIIPKAKRITRGKGSYRVWETNDLPQIGEAIGYLKPPATTKVVAGFSLKGGTGKSTVTFQLARALALHGIRTLVIGMDAQETVSQHLSRARKSKRADSDKKELQEPRDPDGLYHILTDEADLDRCILPTDLSTLHYIPETVELSVLERVLKQRMRKEYVIAESITQPLIAQKRYDVIIFDCNPAWSDLVTGALAASNFLISPLGCDESSLKASKIFISLLASFTKDMKHRFERFFIVPTLLDPSKLSHNILARYRLEYEDICTATAIRRAIVVQEANLLGKSLMEIAPTSAAYQDAIGVFKELNAAFVGDEEFLDESSHNRSSMAFGTGAR